MRRSCIRTKSRTLSMGILLIGYLLHYLVYLLLYSINNTEAISQQYIQTIKYRNLAIDLGNGVKTNAQLTFPTIGKGPFPGVLLIPGSGALDMNETLGFVLKNSLNRLHLLADSSISI